MPVRDDERIAVAEEIVEDAWAALPVAHKTLLESIGCRQVKVVCGPIASAADDLRSSSDNAPLTPRERLDLEDSVAAWLPDLRLVLVDIRHLEGP